MTKESEGYERLVKDVHDALLKNDGVENITVLQNVKLRGKSGASHQIDVYWEFRLAGVTYKTCIECKQFKESVKKSHVAAFASILEDIGNATGIFATTEGFQNGAKLLAKEKGIRLILVNYILKTIHLTGHFKIPQISVTNLTFDTDHAKQLLRERGLQVYSLQTHDISGRELIFDSQGTPKCKFRDLFTLLPTGSSQEIEPEDAYFPTEIGNLKIKSAEYTVAVHEHQTEDIITVDDVARAIMEDVFENNSLYLREDGSIEAVNR
ncbi:hypothetical protein Gmet_2490 [Geobacter metallireducens GS-15]|uniref:Restriction endonuclease type IV Mrr domain-containing protein n=1 Tax=Geobacter metallireducens (strain ATCC 53774 / DSM 7210 / GS-15) TaxID=269799 RepID=Q39SR0_GEOMG|nr:restriction endonuclease [Geobacter metallireducens]ABB32714.1 hypothetical protein Gmet_2490 [Geobacter metallireducens GS-15]